MGVLVLVVCRRSTWCYKSTYVVDRVRQWCASYPALVLLQDRSSTNKICSWRCYWSLSALVLVVVLWLRSWSCKLWSWSWKNYQFIIRRKPDTGYSSFEGIKIDWTNAVWRLIFLLLHCFEFGAWWSILKVSMWYSHVLVSVSLALVWKIWLCSHHWNRFQLDMQSRNFVFNKPCRRWGKVCDQQTVHGILKQNITLSRKQIPLIFTRYNNKIIRHL